MADISKSYVDLASLQRYDGKIKDWSNSASQVGIKTVLKNGDNLLFYAKPKATTSDTADFTIAIGGASIDSKLDALAAIITATYDAQNEKYTISGLDTSSKTTLVAAINELLRYIGDVSDLDVALSGETQPSDLVTAANLLASHIGSIALDLNTLNTKVGDIPAEASSTDVVSYIGEAITNAVEGLDTQNDVTIASQSGKAVSIVAGISETDGVIGAGSGTAITLADVASTGAAEDVTYDNKTSGLSSTDVKAAIDELANQSAGGVASKTVYMTDNTSTAGTDFATIYKIYQGAEGSASTPEQSELIGTINIPKDQFVDEAALVDITYDSTDGKLYDGLTDVTELIVGAGGTATAADAGKYVKLVFAITSGTAAKSTIYISVKALSHIYTGDSTAEIAVSVDSSTDVITATIVDVAASKVTYIEADATEGIARESVGAALTRLDGADTVTGSVAKKAKDAAAAAVATLNTSSDVVLASENVSTGAVSFTQSVDESNGIIGAVAGDKIVFTPVTNNEIDALFTSSTPSSGD